MDIDNIIEQTAARAPKKAGRKNNGLTQEHFIEYHKKRNEIGRRVRTAQNAPDNIIERVTGEVIQPDDLEQFEAFFNMQCNDTLEQFKINNPELIKKHPYNWHKQLLIELKHNTPAVGPGDIDKMLIVWDCLKELLYKIGLYPTFELFSIFTGIYKYQIEERAGVNPKYIDFTKRIKADTDAGLINDLHNNPYNQTNKIFLAKTRGIIEQTAPRQVEVVHQIQSYNSISDYRLEKKD